MTLAAAADSLETNLVAALHGVRDIRLETRALPQLGERDVFFHTRGERGTGAGP